MAPSLIQIWWHVMLPLGKPALITLGILNTLYCWNDVLISLLVLQKERTLMVGIAALKGEYTTNIPLLIAGIVIAAAPDRHHLHHLPAAHRQRYRGGRCEGVGRGRISINVMSPRSSL